MSPLPDFLRKWRDNRSGAFSVYAALTLPVLLAGAGFGLDYMSALSVKSRLDAAADTAAIASVRAANDQMRKNPRNLRGDALVAAARAAGQTAAQQTFNANASASLDAKATVTAPLPDYDSKTRTFHQAVAYTFDAPLHFGQLVGQPTMTLAGSSSAEQKATSYIRIYVLVDTSQSMGIAANQQEMDKLTAGVGCVFACHSTEPGTTLTSVGNLPFSAGYDYARANGVKLRIDVARQAIFNMAQSAKTLSDGANIQFEVYAMERESVGPAVPTNAMYLNNVLFRVWNWPQPVAASYIKPVWPASGGKTTDYDSLIAAMSPNSKALDLATLRESEWSDPRMAAEPNKYITVGYMGDTDLVTSISQFSDKYLQSNGDGNSAESPINYVFVVTDGLENTPHRYGLPTRCYYTDYAAAYNTSENNWCINPIPTSACDPLKNKGAQVGTLYTTYLPLMGGVMARRDGFNASYEGTPYYYNDAYTNVPLIAGNMNRCGNNDPSWHLEASDDKALLDGMNALFQKALGSVNRLTQ